MSGVIYYIQSPSGKGYVGKTDNFEERMKGHQKISTKCTLLKRAIDKYGWDNMKVTILLKCKLEDMPYYEQLMVDAYDTFGPNGYNCTTGGEKNKIISNEMRTKISSSLCATYRDRINLSSCILKSKTGTFSTYLPRSWTLDRSKLYLSGFASYDDAVNMRTYCYENYIRGHQIPLSCLHDSKIMHYITKPPLRARGTGKIYKQKKTSKKHTAFLPSHAQKYYKQKSYAFPTYKEAEDFLETCTTCFITEENNSYKFTVPPPWLASPDAQKTYTGFKTRQEAQLFMDNFYIIYVEGYDKPLPCVTSSVPNSQMPYNPYFIF